jgi:integrase
MLCAALRSRCEQLGFADNQVRFDPGTAKKDRPRVVPLTPELRATLEMQLSRRTAECRECRSSSSLRQGRWEPSASRGGIPAFESAWAYSLHALREASDTKRRRADCSQEKKQKKLRYVGLLFCDPRRTAPEC